MSRVRLGVSSCLLGNHVRFDGGHKRSSFVSDTLASYFELLPFCPEMAVGLGSPRTSLRLVGDVASPRLVSAKEKGLDVSEDVVKYGQNVASAFGDICGFIVKKDSPSCGMERVRVYNADNIPSRQGTGLFTSALMEANPWMPIEEEGRLNDPYLRAAFLERVFVCWRWRQLLSAGLSPGGLVEFHSVHKYMIMSRSQKSYRQLGRMIANIGKGPLDALADAYFRLLMEALKQPAGRKRHANVLYHLLGYFKRHLPGSARQELLNLIENYRKGDLPLIAPLTLLRHHLGSLSDDYLNKQHYFEPYPVGLMSRNWC